MRFLVLLVTLLWFPACLEQADDDAGDDDAGDDDSHEAPCAFLDPPAASITVEQHVTEGDWSLYVTGQVRDGPAPAWHEVLVEDGACRYMVFLPGFCDPPCEYDEVCTGDGECVGWPAGLPAGTLTVEGLGASMALEAEDYDPGLYVGYTSLPLDQFGEGTPVAVALEGDDFPAVELEARGVDALDSGLSEAGLQWTDGQPATLTWTAGGDPEACVEIWLYTANTGHGLPITHVAQCVGADTGALVVPTEVTDPFPPWTTPEACAGVDCPYSELRRFTRSVADTAYGPAELVVFHRERFLLDVE